ncbi:ABC transporter permease [Paenibacillus wynnii]|nr:ABC transporter permease [Paenibacillus wynnii]
MNLFSIENVKLKRGRMAVVSLLFILTLFAFLSILGLSAGGQVMFPNMTTALREINNSIIWPSCLIFTGVWASKIFVEEFRSKTMMNIWVCGIDRNRIVLVKLFLILSIGMLITLLSTLVLNFLLIILAPYMAYAEKGMSFSSHFSAPFIELVTLNAIYIGITSLLSVSFGMRGYSTSTTIIASLVMAVLWASQISLQIPGFSTSNIRFILALISVISVLFLLRRTNRLDF